MKILLVLAIASWISGCASLHPGADQCAKCYIGLAQVLGAKSHSPAL